MGDKLTTLRELSVGYYFYTKTADSTLPTPSVFVDICNRNIKNSKIVLQDISKNPENFNDEELITIKNGLKIAKIIEGKLHINKNPIIEWVGRLTQSGSPIDIIINDKRISLKEDSYILSNMGLYDYLNIITNSKDHKKGLNIFKIFAPREFNEWFKITLGLLIEQRPNMFSCETDKYKSNMYIENNTLILSYKERGKQDKCVNIVNINNCSYEIFMSYTNPIIREKVFCKWIKTIEKKQKYYEAKRRCSVTAGQNLIREYKKCIGTSPNSLLRLFNIDKNEYFYAKTTISGCELYYVPPISSCSNLITILNIEDDVPKSQLSIITTLKNTKSGVEIILRNEMRYSHGQFNGTPEAKLYFKRGFDLSIIYEPITI